MDDKKSIFDGLTPSEKQAKLEEMRKIWAAETEQKKTEKKERERIIEELVSQKESLMEAYKNEQITLSKLTSELKKIESNPFYIKYMAEVKDENAKWGAAVEAADFYSEEQRAKDANADLVADAVVRRMYDSMSPEEQRRQDEIRKAKLEEENRLSAAQARKTTYLYDLRNSLRNLYLYVERGSKNSKDDVRKLLTAEEVTNLGLHDVELLYTDEQIDSMTEEELKEISGKIREIRSATKAEKDFDYPESEAQKIIRKEIEELYNDVMKLKYYVPGYLFSDEERYNNIESAMDAYDVIDLDLIFKMALLKEDIKAAAEEVANPSMTPEERELYFKLADIVYNIALAKEDDPNYIYSDVAKADEVLAEFERLKTKNPHITEMIYIITKDIKKFKEKTEGKEAADAYQKKLDDLNVKSPLAEFPTTSELNDAAEDMKKPEKKGIKDKRKATEKEKDATKKQKKLISDKALKTWGVIALIVMFASPGVQVVFPFVVGTILAVELAAFLISYDYKSLPKKVNGWFKTVKEKYSEGKEKREERRLKREQKRAERRGISENPGAATGTEEPAEDLGETHSRGGK